MRDTEELAVVILEIPLLHLNTQEKGVPRPCQKEATLGGWFSKGK